MLGIISRRGLAAALMTSLTDVPSQFVADCHAAIRSAAATLLERAQRDGSVRADVTLSELLTLVHAIGVVAESTPEQTDRADRLLALLMDGLRAGPHDRGHRITLPS